MGYSDEEHKWTSDLCKSDLIVQDVAILCTCNAFGSNMVGVFSDFTRELGEPVQFPAIVVEKRTQSLVSGSVLGEREQGKTEKKDDVSAIVSSIADVDGANYVWAS